MAQNHTGDPTRHLRSAPPTLPLHALSGLNMNREAIATGSRAEKESVGVRSDLSGVYRYTCLIIWLGTSVLMVIDRFYWNVWPRQTICSPGCGGDFFCDMDEDPGCLKPGPWSAKVFDAIARLSSRVIISTTNLMFITMCHGTWNYLSEVRGLRRLLYAWRSDNFWLHSVGGWTMGISIMAHIWTLFLPSMFHGYGNTIVGGPIEPPLQVGLNTGNIDVENENAVWGYDDVWRIVWMTAIFCFLMPLSRSAWALRKNFSLAMWLHIGVGVGVFFDSWRRKTHPHVWILNTPVFLWYLADKIWCSTRGRVDPFAEATRVILDDEYMLLLWKDWGEAKRICDIYWLKHTPSDGRPAGRTGEMPHPFTTCSSHDVFVHKGAFEFGVEHSQVRPTIEVPDQTDVRWPGHRFFLASAASRMSENFKSSEPSDTTFDSGDDGASISSFSSPANGRRHKPQRDGTVVRRFQTFEGGSTHRRFFTQASVNGGEDGMMIGADTDGGVDEVSMMDDGKDTKPVPSDKTTARRSLAGSSTTRHYTEESKRECSTTTGNAIVPPAPQKGHGPRKHDKQISPRKDQERKAVLKRLPTQHFQEIRMEQASNRIGAVLGGTWSKMAIVRIHKSKEKKASECSCMGLTYILSIVRRAETASIADPESSNGTASVPIRTYGPYRSEYGRLGEFPNLPPLLIIATGAGAALALDFVGYVRANNLVPARPVLVCYSSASLALLQFVTNTLLAVNTPGIRIRTALTRHNELEVFDTTRKKDVGLDIGRMNVQSIVKGVSDDTEVFFCGGGAINALLRSICAKRGMKYVGSSVQ